MAFQFDKLLGELGGFLQQAPQFTEQLKAQRLQRQKAAIEIDQSKQQLLDAEMKNQEMKRQIDEQQKGKAAFPEIIAETLKSGTIDPGLFGDLSPDVITSLVKNLQNLQGANIPMRKAEAAIGQVEAQTEATKRSQDRADEELKLKEKQLELKKHKLINKQREDEKKLKQKLGDKLYSQYLQTKSQINNDLQKRKDIKEYSSLSAQYSSAASTWDKIIKSGSDKRAAGEAIVNVVFNKFIDPGSVVRESEFERLANGATLKARVQGIMERINKITKGKDPTGMALPVEVVQEYRDVMDDLMAARTELLMNQLKAGYDSAELERTQVGDKYIANVFDQYMGSIPTNIKDKMGITSIMDWNPPKPQETGTTDSPTTNIDLNDGFELIQ